MIHMLLYALAHKVGRKLVESRLARSLGQRLLRRLAESRLGRVAEPLMQQLRDADEEPAGADHDRAIGASEPVDSETDADLRRATEPQPDKAYLSSARHMSGESLASHTAESEVQR